MRLKQSELKQFRLKLLQKQNFLCPLCGTEILPEEAALDHDHKTGHVRAVLHRSCNQAEGRVINWATRSRSTDYKDFVRRLLNYWAWDYSNNPVHPSHKTEAEKQILRLQKKLKRLKSEKHKQRTRAEIQRLKL